jgi:hypothetical protein
VGHIGADLDGFGDVPQVVSKERDVARVPARHAQEAACIGGGAAVLDACPGGLMEPEDRFRPGGGIDGKIVQIEVAHVVGNQGGPRVRLEPADPPACAVAEPAPLEKSRFRRYMGERAFPFILQNLHRYAFYAAVIFIIILWKDTIDAFFFTDPTGTHIGVGIGSLVFLADILLLTLYTFSCHSWRHLIGGSVNCYSCSLTNRTKYGLWSKVSFLNERHGRWAMMSLISVGLTDVYVWLVATGRITDIRLF